MIILINVQTIVADVTANARARLAKELGIDPKIILVDWAYADDGTFRPDLRVELPPPLPPAEMDVNDKAAMAAWEAEAAELPGQDEFLKARNPNYPEVIKRHGAALVHSAATFLRAFQVSQ